MFGREGLSCTTAYNIIHLTLLAQTVVGNFFTSVLDMEALVYQENQLLNTLTEYIRTEQARLNLLNTKLNQMKKVRPSWLDIQKIISDPVNAFSLVRRLTREWPLILNMMVNNFEITGQLAQLPKEEDIEGVKGSLMRLQEIYTLYPSQFTKEKNLQNQSFIDFSALDCFEIGKYVYKNHKYLLANLWFNEALIKIANKDSTVRQDQVLTYLFLSTLYSDCNNGSRSKSATNVLQYLMSQYPDYTLDKEAASLFRQALSANCSWPLDQLSNTDLWQLEETQAFSTICQGIGTSFSSELRCFYIHYYNPRLLIAPFKMEELHLNPPVLMFHNVVSDQEVEDLKTAFGPVRSRCQTLSNETYGETNSYRSCDVSWLMNNTITTSTLLTRRVGDMTNLMMETSEPNQVASYGLGGEFRCHYDPITVDEFIQFPNGNRIATVMFYLNDVDSGGFTVFPYINVAITPQKGSAVFWFNLDHTSTILTTMLHGGCPVLRGSKWVLNKWIHEGGQNFDMFCPADKIFPKQRYYLNRYQ